jgi:hypothetical protein
MAMAWLTTSINSAFTILGKLDRFSKLESVGGLIAAGMDWLDSNYGGKITVYISW